MRIVEMKFKTEMDIRVGVVVLPRRELSERNEASETDASRFIDFLSVNGAL